MEKVRILQKHIGRKSLYILLALTIVITVCARGWTQDRPPSSEDAEKQKAASTVVSHLLQAAREEYQQGLYEQAEKTLTGALDYRKYLDAKTQDELDKLLDKSRKGKEERNKILEAIRQADQSVKDNKLLDAKAKLESVRNSEYLNTEERNLIVEGVKKLDVQIGAQSKDIAEIYNRSVDLYKAGELEKAREGFAKVVSSTLPVPPNGHRAEDYIARIDAQLAQKTSVTEKKVEAPAKGTADILEVVPIPVEANKPAKTVTAAGADSYIEKVNQKISVLRGHTKGYCR